MALEGGHECNTASRTVEIEICNVRYTRPVVERRKGSWTSEEGRINRLQGMIRGVCLSVGLFVYSMDRICWKRVIRINGKKNIW